MSFAPETHPRAASLDLWRHFRAFLCSIFDIFGGPEDIAARHTLTRKEWLQTNTWISAAETLLRRLLLIEAAAIPAKAPTTSRTPSPRVRARRLLPGQTRRLARPLPVSSGPPAPSPTNGV